MKTNAPFEIVTPENQRNVTERINRDGGYVVIAEPGSMSFPDEGIVVDAVIELFNNPKIIDMNTLQSSGTGFKATDSRTYRLCRINQNERQRFTRKTSDLYMSLPFSQNYRFVIGGQFTASRGFLEQHKYVVYIPPGRTVEAGIRHALWHMGAKINEQLVKVPAERFLFTQQNILKIMKYAMEDLKTNEVLQTNFKASEIADAVCLDCR